MAGFVKIECRQCGESDSYPVEQFIEYLKDAENTRINAEDSGSLDLSLYICAICDEDDD